MAFEQTEAIVLRKVDFSETSRIVTFLTPDRGRMACMVKGARRKGSPMATLLDTYNCLEITYTWKESRQVQLLTEATLLDSYGTVKARVESIACAAFLLEMAGLVAQDNNPAPELFDATREGLEQLAANKNDPFSYVTLSVYTILDAAGFAPDIADNQFLEYIPLLPRDKQNELRQAVITLASGNRISEAGHIPLVMHFLNEYGRHHFEHPLKSYAFLKSMMESTA